MIREEDKERVSVISQQSALDIALKYIGRNNPLGLVFLNAARESMKELSDIVNSYSDQEEAEEFRQSLRAYQQKYDAVSREAERAFNTNQYQGFAKIDSE